MRQRRFRPKRRLIPLLMLTLFLCFWGKQAMGSLLRPPQAILVLGGAPEREEFTAQFAQEYPDLPIWVSSGSNPEYADWVFEQAQIDPNRVRLDYQAVDTVTNFTTLVDDLKAEGIDCIYLVTSDYHMRRARVIGQIVLGSRDISFRPVSVPSHQPSESLDRVLRDGARAVLWVVTGKTGSTLGPTLLQQREATRG